MAAKTDNLSAVLLSKGNLSLEQRPIPKPADDEVLIAINSVGICGSDVHYLQHGAIGDFVVKAPMVLGHESSGTVVETGKRVHNLKAGDRVAIEPGVPCRTCDYCKTGVYNLCADMKFCATPPYDGTLTRFYTHPADFCFKLPENVSFEEGAFLEPLSVAVHACRRAKVSVGQIVLICGSGPIGLLNLLTAKAMGASKVCIIDIVKQRLETAKKLGADFIVPVDPKKEPKETAKDIINLLGCSPDVSIDCSGAESAVQTAIFATKSGGIVQLIGHGRDFINFPVFNALIREVDIRGTFRYANCYKTALSLIADGKIDVKPLITHKFKLEEALKAFETAHDTSKNAIKVMIKCA